MKEYLWETFVNALIVFCLPMICFYHCICDNIFLNVSVQNANILEKTGNILLTPFQYLFAGKEARLNEDGSWEISQKFDYSHFLLPKSIISLGLLPSSLIFGSTVKGLSFLSPQTRMHHHLLIAHRDTTQIHSNNSLYEQMGLQVGDSSSAAWISSQGYQRRPGDEKHLQMAKEGLRDIGQILTKCKIPWWVDCGTLLGAYRYGGIIPWDNDIDIALLLPDFENARRAFNLLNPEKYVVQDWSGRDFPNTFFKIYVKSTGDFIDIYFYEIDEEEKCCKYIFALDKSIFFFEWWKEGERRFKKPVAFHQIFPLKKAMFDGVEVFVPNEPVSFLQRYYGENLSPVRIYDATTNRFEKDLSHPYWLNPYVH